MGHDSYVKKLEEMILHMQPYYDKYFQVAKLPKPELDIVILAHLKRKDKVPAILKSSGVLESTSHRVKARKN